MSDRLTQLRATLEDRPIAELRSMAKNNFGIRLSRDDTKEDLINKLVGFMHKTEFAMVEGDLKPGWARIKLHPVPGRPPRPIYVNHNDYQCFIPVDVEVDVPLKLIAEDGSLACSGEWRVSQNEFNETVTTFVQANPFSVIATVAGPDPRPGFEVRREAKIKAKRDFCRKYGYWPKDDDVKDILRARIQHDIQKGE